MLVIDASAVTELLHARPAAAAVRRAIKAHAFDLHAPELFLVEVERAAPPAGLGGRVA